jgi:ADP-ribose pyrophosphatase
LPEERTLRSRSIFKGRAFNVRIDTVIDAGGKETTREIIEHSECVAVVAVDTNGDILLVKQYRKAVEKDLLEIPAGGIDRGEDPETTVKRELQEEIGKLPGRVTRIGGYYSSPGFCTEYLYLFLAENFKDNQLYAEDTPGIQTVRAKPNQILHMIRSGEICDSKSIAGLLYYLDYKKRQAK